MKSHADLALRKISFESKSSRRLFVRHDPPRCREPFRIIGEAIDWYTKNFRCSVDYVDETWALLDFANTKLALVLPDQHPPHFGVVRSDAEKFGHLLTHRDGIASIYIKDLAGNSLEILKERGIDSKS